MEVWELMSEFGEARLNKRYQPGDVLISCGCKLDSALCDCHGIQCYEAKDTS